MQVAANGEQLPLSYRYTVGPKELINAYKPKDLEPNVNKHELRSSVFGAIYKTKFAQLPTTDHCRVVWEAHKLFNNDLNQLEIISQLWVQPSIASCQVSVGEEAPATITPAKPKFYLLGTVSLEGNTAMKLK